MRLQRIEIENFRCYQEHTMFDFKNADCVLFAGSNGKGKSTIIDAIEWCLTGDCYRISDPIKKRIKGKTKRINDEKGSLKSIGAKADDWVKVELYLADSNIKYVCRRQKEDSLLKDKSELTIKDEKNNIFSNKEASKLLKEIFNIDKETFYQYYVCDVQKASQFRMKKRNEWHSALDDFTQNYTKEKILIDNLDSIKEHLQGELTAQEEKLEKTQNNKDSIEKTLKKELKENVLQSYPNAPFFEKEDLDILNVTETKIIIDQSTKLKRVAYKKLLEYGQKKNNHEDAIRKTSALEKEKKGLTFKIDENQVYLIDLFQQRLWTQENLNEKQMEISKLQNECKKVQNLSSKKYLELRKIIEKLKIEEFDEKWITSFENEISTFNETINSLNTDIEEGNKGNGLIQSLTELVSLMKNFELEEYSKISSKCPVCGSEEFFGTMGSSDLAKEAAKYLTDNEQRISEKKAALEKNKQKLSLYYKEQIKKITDKLQEKIASANSDFERWEKTYNNCKSDFIKHKLTIDTFMSGKTGFEQADLNELIKSIEDSLDKKIQNEKLKMRSETELQQIDQQVQQILGIISQNQKEMTEMIEKYTNISDQQFINACKSWATGIEEILNFDADLLNNKLQLLSQHKEQLENKENLKKYKDLDEEISKLKKSIGENKEFLSKVNNVRNNINVTINKLETEEIQGVGPYLNSLYRKLIKHNSIEGFEVVPGKQTTAEIEYEIQDLNGAPVFNQMSEGQLGVFIVSYFIGSAIKRADTYNFRSYFIDDITSCMDDINVLSFLELLKYQLKNKNGSSKNHALEQIFFATCDHNLAKMFKYKMEGMQIEVEPIEFA